MAVVQLTLVVNKGSSWIGYISSLCVCLLLLDLINLSFIYVLKIYVEGRTLAVYFMIFLDDGFGGLGTSFSNQKSRRLLKWASASLLMLIKCPVTVLYAEWSCLPKRALKNQQQLCWKLQQAKTLAKHRWKSEPTMFYLGIFVFVMILYIISIY